MVKTSPSKAEDAGLLPGWGTKIPHALWSESQNIKQKEYCSKFNKNKKSFTLKKKSLKKEKKLVNILPKKRL